MFLLIYIMVIIKTVLL